MTMFIVLSSWPQVIARVHSVHLMNVDQRQATVDPQTKPPDLGCESACFRQLASTTTIAIYYYYSARKLILIYRPTEGRVRRLSWPRHCRKGTHSSCPRLYEGDVDDDYQKLIIYQGYSNGGPRSTIRTTKTLLADRDWLLWKWKIRP